MPVRTALCMLIFVVLGWLPGGAERWADATSRFGRQPGGSVVGRIQDIGGGPLPGVTVVLARDTATRKTTSNSSGRYSIPDVPPGTYRLEMQLAGFRPLTRSDVVVTSASTTTVDAELRINSGRSTLAPDGTDTTDPVLARAVYEVVLKKIYANTPGDISVVRTSLVPAVLSHNDWSGMFAAVVELRPALERAADRPPVFLRPDGFPPGVTLVNAGESGRPVTSFTPVFFSADGRHAVVYFEHYCGNLCGEGTMVWLTRTDAGVWQIGGSRMFWVS